MSQLQQTITWKSVETIPPTVGIYIIAMTGWVTEGKYDPDINEGDGWDRYGVTHWTEVLKHPSELQYAIDLKSEAAAADFAKNGPRCIECDARICECECN